MINIEKFSDAVKVVNANKTLRNFDAKLIRYQVQTAKKEKLQNSRIKAHNTMLKRLGQEVTDLKAAKITPVATFDRAYEHFQENVHGIDGKLLARLDQDKLEKDLSLCENKAQEEVVTKYWEEKSKVLMKDIDLLVAFYTAIGKIKQPEPETKKAPAKQVKK